jgi:hypothetical protein
MSTINIEDICNNNSKNIPTDEVYNAFNNLVFSSDVKLLGKLLHRFKYFLDIKDLPGDIVEIGVFKGSGVATFSKFIEIFIPNSNKKVIGFDIFDSDDKSVILSKDTPIDQKTMNLVYSKVNSNELSLESVSRRLDQMNIKNKYLLVKGDVADSIPKFVDENPGFRISMIYIDVDLERPTYFALKYLWDRLLPGGIVLFDEFEYHKFSESNGVEKFLKEMNLPFELKSTNWIAPTCYMIKKTF